MPLHRLFVAIDDYPETEGLPGSPAADALERRVGDLRARRRMPEERSRTLTRTRRAPRAVPEASGDSLRRADFLRHFDAFIAPARDGGVHDFVLTFAGDVLSVGRGEVGLRLSDGDLADPSSLVMLSALRRRLAALGGDARLHLAAHDVHSASWMPQPDRPETPGLLDPLWHLLPDLHLPLGVKPPAIPFELSGGIGGSKIAFGLDVAADLEEDGIEFSVFDIRSGAPAATIGLLVIVTRSADEATEAEDLPTSFRGYDVGHEYWSWNEDATAWPAEFELVPWSPEGEFLSEGWPLAAQGPLVDAADLPRREVYPDLPIDGSVGVERRFLPVWEARLLPEEVAGTARRFLRRASDGLSQRWFAAPEVLDEDMRIRVDHDQTLRFKRTLLPAPALQLAGFNAVTLERVSEPA